MKNTWRKKANKPATKRIREGKQTRQPLLTKPNYPNISPIVCHLVLCARDRHKCVTTEPIQIFHSKLTTDARNNIDDVDDVFTCVRESMQRDTGGTTQHSGPQSHHWPVEALNRTNKKRCSTERYTGSPNFVETKKKKKKKNMKRRDWT
jgi:hypothetical protein